MSRILITGANGQIGSYLAEMLVAEGHDVIGLIAPRDAPVVDGVRALDVELCAANAAVALDACGPLDAIVHLAGQSSVAKSWEQPLGAFELHAHLTAALVASLVERKTNIPFVHASSAEIFGRSTDRVQSERTAICPVSPYGASKAAAHFSVSVARDGYRLPMSNLIFFPGESERRGEQFVFRKITRGVAAIHLGLATSLALGNTSIVRDFCHARDFAMAAKMLALGAAPGDYVVASGEGHTIQEVADTACALLGLDGSKVITSSPSLVRATDIPSMIGDSTKLRALGWAPSLSFRELVEKVTRHDLALLQADCAASEGS